MRIAAGIMMIAVGVLSFSVPNGLTEEIGLRISVEIGDLASFMMTSSGFIVFLSIVFAVLTIGGGICAFVKKAWWWALLGGITCMILGVIQAMISLLTIPPLYFNLAGAVGASLIGVIAMILGILAVIFLIIKRDSFGYLPPE
jgi:hypothetical protein